MLDSETKRRIDTCRDILVGKIPDPKSQVEQITIALIYKFMNDMDDVTEDLGGKKSFFTGDFEKYKWRKLLSPQMKAYEILNLYAEAIGEMTQNINIPVLFRNIFKNAYLPYRDPETLKSFLQEIDYFTYDHSEKLGDAFEYLLSVLGSQGDAGQFRTPRHIIDFIVDLIAPQKHETILDPACGTAGFLISAYKYITKHNQTMTSGERTELAKNLKGYDISPDMVRLSTVNMYLHGFLQPSIDEYDTLTSLERWNENYDIILANPPFMSPKGGIKPHNKFSVQATRSEVLFVDYIAEHIHSKGRAGIIVPEGIIFQSGTAYKQLRKMLVDNFLIAVISLPSGVFNPYSGVKTSILILDRSLAKRSDSIAFFKAEQDGFALGAKRNSIEKNDLPNIVTAYEDFKNEYVKNRKIPEIFKQNPSFHIVPKSKLAENDDYNLSGDRYIETKAVSSVYPMVELGEVCEVITKGTTPTTVGYSFVNEGINFIKIESISQYCTILSEKLAYITQDCHNALNRSRLKENDILFSIAGALGRVAIINKNILPANTNQALAIIRLKENISHKYVMYFLNSKIILDKIYNIKIGVAQYNISLKQISELKIPLPPLSIQQEIVAQIESYQKIIDGAKQVVDHYKPVIPIDENWEVVALGDTDLFHIESGGTPLSTEETYWNGDIAWATLVDLPASNFITNISKTERNITDLGLKNSSAKLLPINSVLVSSRATIGRVAINKIPLATNQGFKNIIIKDTNKVNHYFLAYMMKNLIKEMENLATGGTFKEISKSALATLKIPLPPLSIQQKIVDEIEEIQECIEANKKLITLFEQKIKDTINHIWQAD